MNHHPNATCIMKPPVHFGLASYGWDETWHHFKQGCDFTIYTNKITKMHIKVLAIITYFWYVITPRCKGLYIFSMHTNNVDDNNSTHISSTTPLPIPTQLTGHQAAMPCCAYPGSPGILLCGFLCLVSLCLLVTSSSPHEPIILIASLRHFRMHAVLSHMLLCATPTFSSFQSKKHLHHSIEGISQATCRISLWEDWEAWGQKDWNGDTEERALLHVLFSKSITYLLCLFSYATPNGGNIQ